MHAFPSERRRSKLPIVVILVLIVVAAIAGGAYVLSPRFESEPPQITLSSSADVLGVGPLEIKVTDNKAQKSVTRDVLFTVQAAS